MKPKWKREAQKARRHERLRRLRDVFANGMRSIARACARADRMLADNPPPFAVEGVPEGLKDGIKIVGVRQVVRLGEVALDTSRSVSQSDDGRLDGTVGKPTSGEGV